MAKGTRGGKAGSSERKALANLAKAEAKVKSMRVVGSVEEAERTRGAYEQALAERRKARDEVNVARYGTANPTMDDLTKKAWEDYNKANGLPASNRMRVEERSERLARFMSLNSTQNTDGDEVVTTRGRATTTKRSTSVPKTASSISDATKKAENYVRRMNVGDSVKVGAYTYTKMNSGKFSYKETGGGYRIVSGNGVSDAIVDSMKIKRK